LKSDGSIVGWGDDYDGQATPPDGNDYVAIAAGVWHSLALRTVAPPPIEAQLRILPALMIRCGPLQRLMAILRLPEDITKEQVDSNELLVLSPGQIPASSQYVFGFPPWRPRSVVVVGMFDKGELMAAITDNGRVEVQVFGKLKNGQQFFGKDEVWIMATDIRCLVGFAMHWLEADCSDPDWCEGFDLNYDGIVNLLDFALTDGCSIEVLSE
jgi:hypothetical protein